ncbi:DNA cytosine methyltransferase [Ascidiaceihabitans sp.]|nr:DNA cytosine methyltransferase [Ascidiaceihabitans sp.]
MYSIDLFAGCGGLSHGLRMAGFECVWANEFDKNASKTFQTNFPNSKVSEDDIRSIDASTIRESLGLKPKDLNLLVGGFPCQGFSTYGQRDTADERNQLYIDYIRFVEEFRPKRLLIENVVGMLSMSNGEVVRDISQRLEALGYYCNVQTLQAADYGVPQLRRRVFIYGYLDNHGISWPNPTHSAEPASDNSRNIRSTYVSVYDALSDLPTTALKPKQVHEVLEYPEVNSLSEYQKKMRNGSDWLHDHSAKQMMSARKLRVILMKQGDYGSDLADIDTSQPIAKSVIAEIVEDCGLRRPIHLCRKQDQEKELALRALFEKADLTYADLVEFIGSGGFANKYRRLDAQKPSHTLVAHMARDCSDFIHPVENRFISVREAARLQSFEDSFKFEGSQFAQLKQIGNAVPPLLGFAVGKAIVETAANGSPR